MRLSALVVLLLIAWPGRAADDHPFENRVRPLLVTTCFRCHGGQKVQGGLRVDSREALLRGGKSGPALVPGNPETSLLVRALRRHEGVAAMPPDKPVDGVVLAALVDWVKAGAPWSTRGPAFVSGRHWAFEAVKRPSIPSGATHPVDAFLMAMAEGASPRNLVDRRTLLRRASYDLLGLPPTADEVEAFLADPRPDAIERMVDRLLASPHYGERWGRHWLDLVRYADSAGENSDHPLPHAWRYRNGVITALNADKPYDDFVRDQIAGDLRGRQMPETTANERLVATGFLALARRFGHDIDKDIHLTLEDTIDTLGKAILGLTLGCARCHDHKYDPISNQDYYALYGIFSSTRFSFPGCEPKQQPRDLVPLLGPGAGVAYAVAEGVPADARLQERGDPEKLGPAVPRRWLSLLGGNPVPPGTGSGRLALADWITDPGNPLTARVLVNRLWQYHFGEGLVATPNDFGTRGSPPRHPLLLDWLANEIVRSGWSLKAMHRLLMTSEAYRQEGLPTSSPQVGYRRRRLDAEQLRDSLLMASGRLDRSPGGPHPFPEEKTWNFTQHNPFHATYETERRSVYLMTLRNRRHPFLGLFDGADPNASTPQRGSTTVPTQALYFLNDSFVHRVADRIAEEILASPSSTDRLHAICQRLFQRPPLKAERDVLQGLLSAESPSREDWAAVIRVLLGSSEFLYVD